MPWTSPPPNASLGNKAICSIASVLPPGSVTVKLAERGYDTPVRIGPIQLAIPFCQAGLAGYSDRAMRVVARRRGCPYAVTEALLDTILLGGGMGLKRSIDINDEDHPVAGQLIGSEPHQMAAAARILHAAGYDVIDLNFACPVKKIKNKARGGHMLLDALRAVEVLKAVRDALPPAAVTTVSLRRGFDDSPESVDRFERIVQCAWEYGYAAARVHARTVQQKYAGKSRWAFLAELKRRYPQRTILGSGDVFTAEDAVRMKIETGVDIVWIARGAIGNPWIFRQAERLMEARHGGEGSGLGVQGSVNEEARGPKPESMTNDEVRMKMGQPARDPSCLRASVPSCLSPGLRASVPSCLPADLRASVPSYLPPANPQPATHTPSAIGNRKSKIENPPDSALSTQDSALAPAPPSIHEQREALREHFAMAMEIHGEQLAGRRMRKMGIKYARFHPAARQVKEAFIAVTSLRQWQDVLERYYSTDAPGVWPDPRAADEVNGEEGCETRMAKPEIRMNDE